MKKAFTMIELIFVIVMVGILSAVAIKKIHATREDANAQTQYLNFITLKKDLNTYYLANGGFAMFPDGKRNDLDKMTSLSKGGEFLIKGVNGDNCYSVSLVHEKSFVSEPGIFVYSYSNSNSCNFVRDVFKHHNITLPDKTGDSVTLPLEILENNGVNQ